VEKGALEVVMWGLSLKKVRKGGWKNEEGCGVKRQCIRGGKSDA